MTGTVDEKYLAFLDELRASGKVNMFDSPSILLQQYPEIGYTRSAIEIVHYWMETFEERHSDNEPTAAADVNQP